MISLISCFSGNHAINTVFRFNNAFLREAVETCIYTSFFLLLIQFCEFTHNWQENVFSQKNVILKIFQSNCWPKNKGLDNLYKVIRIRNGIEGFCIFVIGILCGAVLDLGCLALSHNSLDNILFYSAYCISIYFDIYQDLEGRDGKSN